MITTAFDRSLAQRRAALTQANVIRVRRAALKREIRSAEVSLRDLLLDPPDYLRSAKVFDLLMAAPKYGRIKTDRTMKLCGISPSKTVGGMSPRQRTELCSLLLR